MDAAAPQTCTIGRVQLSGIHKSATSPTVTGNTEHTRPENKAFYPALDGLRAVAFLMVFAQHYYHAPWGWTGVNIFFVLSGFLITGILVDSRGDSHRARNFYVRRTLRIFPLYYGIFLLLLLLHPVMHWQWSLRWLIWPLYFGNFARYFSPAAHTYGTPQEELADAQLHSTNHPVTLYLGHFWSLCVEEQFYLFWPWMIFWIRSRRALLWLCGTVVVVTPLARVLTQHLAPQWMIQQALLNCFTPFQLDALLLGALVSLLWRGAHRDGLVRAAHTLLPFALLTAILYLAFTLHPSHKNFLMGYAYPTWMYTWALSFVNVTAALLILSVLRPGGILYRFLCLPALRWVGKITYGAYVLHDILHGWYALAFQRIATILVRHVSSKLVFLQTTQAEIYPLFGLGITLLLAWLSFRFFESPFLNLKERWTICS